MKRRSVGPLAVAAVAVCAFGDPISAGWEECSPARIDDAHSAMRSWCQHAPDVSALTSESILRALESGSGDVVESRASAVHQRSEAARDPLSLGELALRRGSLALAVDFLRIPQPDPWRDFDRLLLLTTADLLQAGGGGISLASIGRIDQLAARLHDEASGAADRSGEHRWRRVRLSRLMAGWNASRASSLAYEGWHSAYLKAEQRLAADALMVMATAGLVDGYPHRSALAVRAEQIYLRSGADAGALLARSVAADRQVSGPPRSPAGVCVAAARDDNLMASECLLALAAMHAAAGGYGQAVVALDRLMAETDRIAPLTRGRHAVQAAPLYELVGRAVDAERVLVAALRIPLPAGIHDRAALQLAAVRRRAGRPVAAERALGQMSQRAAEGAKVRRLIELALIRSSSGVGHAEVEELLGRAERAAVDASDPGLLTTVELGRNAALGTAGPASVPSGVRYLQRSSADAMAAIGRFRAGPTSLPTSISIAEAFKPLRQRDHELPLDGRQTVDRDRLRWHVRRHLDRRQRILMFDARDDAVVVTVLGASDSRAVPLQSPPGRMQALASLWSASIEQDVAVVWRDLGRVLSRLIVEPILATGEVDGVEELIIVPGLGVRGMPFDALPIEARSGDYVGEVFAVSRTASLEALDAAWHRSPRREQALVILPQRNVARTLESSAELSSLPGRALTGRRATETAVRRLAPQAGLVHFGGHAAPVGGAWTSGGLGLWADRLTDGNLTFAEILSLDLAGARVVLLGCETGRGRTFGVGPVASPETSLANAFLAGGARSTISTHWRITDSEARTLAGELYAAGGAQGSVAALTLAKRRLRERFPDLPRLWAAAVWDGAPDRIDADAEAIAPGR